MPTPCPNRQVLQDLLEGRMNAEAEAAIAAHVEQCAACRSGLESLATGDRPAEPLVQKIREERVEIGPAMRGMLDSLAARQPETKPCRPRPADADLPFLDPPDSADCIGRLGRYRILKLLGRGGMGVVFQARDPVLGRLVAVKALAPQLGGDATARERFLREARAAAAISHANVVTIFAVEEVKGLLLLVMEFVDGVSLQDRLRRQVRFSLPEIVRIGAQTAAGLAAAHARGLVHRDIKPANILLARPADQVKIADFGLARATDDAGVTLPGAIMGTPAYMAPEQARGQAMDHRADLFSFGSVLYALCAGQPPYAGSTTLAVIRQVADGLPPSLSTDASSLPPWLVALVSRLHAVNPADRFQSAAEVAQLFRRQWQALQGIGPAAASEPPPDRNSLPPGKATAVVSDGSAAAAAISTNPAAGQTGVEVHPTEKAAGSVLMPPPAPHHEVIPPPVLRSRTPPPLGLVRPDVRRVPPQRGRNGRYRMMALLGALLLLLSILFYGIVNSGGPSRPDLGSGTTPDTNGGDSARFAPPPATERPLRFAVVAQDGIARRTFADWPAAIFAAASGDTVEISGGDPIRIAPLDLHGKALVVRAVSGARPTLAVSRLNEPTEAPLIQSEALLVIEGLDLQCGPAEANAFLPPSLLVVRRAPLRLANCRVLHRGAGPALRLEDAATCEVRNCLLHASQGTAIDCVANGSLRVLVDNCVFSGFSGLAVHQTGQATDAFLDLRHDTLVLHEAVRVHLLSPLREPAKGDGRAFVHVAASRNLFDTDGALLTSQLDRHSAAETERLAQFSRGDLGKNAELRRGKTLAERMNAAIANIKKAVVWRSEQDLYCGSGPLLALVSSQTPKKLHGIGVPDTLAAWNQYWSISPPGIARLAEGSFNGQALRSQAATAPQSLSAADFRRTFPGRGAWRPVESRLEGANTALVGPGDAYAAWKNTIDYRIWLESLRPKKPAG